MMTLHFNHRRFTTQHGTAEGTVCGSVRFAHQILLLMTKFRPELKAVFHNGISGYCEVENPTGLHFEAAASDRPFTVGFWCRALRGARVNPLQYGEDTEWEFYAKKNRKWTLRLHQADDIRIGVTAQVATDDSETWAMMAATYDGSGSSNGLVIYRNGQLLATASSNEGEYTAMRTAALSILKIGRRNHSETGGALGEVAIWSRVLTPEEIKDVYGPGYPYDLTAHAAGDALISWWRPTTQTFTTLEDVVGDNDGTIVNMAAASVITGRK